MLEHFSGVLVNTGTVILGSCLGLLLKKGIPEKVTGAVMTVIGLCTVAIGITGIIKGENQLIMVMALVVGTIIGTLLDIDGKINRIGDRLGAKLSNEDGKSRSDVTSGARISDGFVSASLLFCVGAMTIVGSINAGVAGDNQMLYTKSLLDLISSTMLAASLGIGVLFAAVFVLGFQGLLVLLSIWLGSFLSDSAVAEIVCAGSVMILALGLNLIGITKIKVADMLPALVAAPLLCALFANLQL